MNLVFKRFLFSTFALAGALFAPGLLSAAGPAWDSLMPFKKVDADPASTYPIAQTNGPWTIMATTFRGDNAQKQAQQLAYEFRSKHKWPAYTYEKTFDYSKPVQGRGLDAQGRPNVGRYQSPVVSEVAVLVGDFDTVDDANAQRILSRIKSMEPDCLKTEEAKKAQSLSSFRQLQKSMLASDKTKKGPMGHAIIATNPTLPKEFFAAKGVDKFVVDMNKDVEHSLLDCKGKYSVKVATFNGSVLIDQRKIQEIERKKKTLESRLADAGEKAHVLTVELRKKGWEAYEFHDRESSMVCIGHFDSVGQPRADGKIEIEPDIHKIMKTFGADQAPLATGQALKPKHLVDIPLDIQPMPVEVPKRSISADYQRSMRQER